MSYNGIKKEVFAPIPPFGYTERVRKGKSYGIDVWLTFLYREPFQERRRKELLERFFFFAILCRAGSIKKRHSREDKTIPPEALPFIVKGELSP